MADVTWLWSVILLRIKVIKPFRKLASKDSGIIFMIIIIYIYNDDDDDDDDYYYYYK